MNPSVFHAQYIKSRMSRLLQVMKSDKIFAFLISCLTLTRAAQCRPCSPFFFSLCFLVHEQHKKEAVDFPEVEIVYSGLPVTERDKSASEKQGRRLD